MQTLMDWLSWFVGEIWRLLTTFLTSIWGVVVLASTWTYTCIHETLVLIEKCKSEWSDVQGGTPHPSLGAPGGVGDILAICNTFFPLNEVLGYLIALGALMAVMFIYRTLKSYLPTASSV